jgi:hypothetical protein
MTSTLVYKFVTVHMRKFYPEMSFAMAKDDDGIGEWVVQFPGRQRPELLIPDRYPFGAVETSDYMRHVAKLIDDFLVDEAPWQLWSAYV